MKSELRKQQLTVTLSDCNRLALLMVLWQIQNVICYCTVFALFYFVFEGNFQVQAPGGLIFGETEIYWRVFCVTSLGDLYLEGLIVEILR